MFCKVIVHTYDDVIDVAAVVIGDDHLEVEVKTKNLFRKLVLEDLESQDKPLTDEEVEFCVIDGLYVSSDVELYIMNPNKLVEIPSSKEFEESNGIQKENKEESLHQQTTTH